MKYLNLALLYAVSILSVFAEDSKIAVVDKSGEPYVGFEFKDPRKIEYPLRNTFEIIRDGQEHKSLRYLSNSILIICWMPNPDGNFDTYQISGVEGYQSLKVVEGFLDAFYEQEEHKIFSEKPINIVVAGNNWGAISHLIPKFKELSKKHKFSVFNAGGGAFSKIKLNKEPDSRLQMISNAINKVRSEQGAAPNP